MHLADLVRRLDQLLEPARFPDAQPNGLQVEGRAEVRRVLAGVSASEALFARAAREGFDAVLVHHGLFWDRDARPVTGPLKRRLAALLAADASLVAYHLPLDAHADVGNNAVAARGLGLVELAPFAKAKDVPIGWKGRFPAPVPRKEVLRRLASYYGQEPVAFEHGPDPVRTVGIVSGAASDEVRTAAAEGLDAFVTGEPAERAWYAARELGITFAACGHHATERIGVRALAAWVAKECGLAVEFHDEANPV